MKAANGRTAHRAWSSGLLLAALVFTGASSVAGDPPPPGSLELPPGKEIPQERVRALYREILARWAAGQLEQAPLDLVQLETTAIVEGDIGSRQRLLKAQQAVIQEVFQHDTEVLVPIALLHHETYRRYVDWEARGHATATTHARAMVHDLAVLYERHSESADADAVASRLLTSLGGVLQDSAQHLTAARMYSRAGELDATNLVAHLSLAKIYEKNGDYEGAVAALRRAAQVAPADPEVRLRLAVNLARLGRNEEAQGLFEQVIAGREAAWAIPLAYQQLAELHREAGRLAAAEEVLKDGLDRFQESTRLRIQLASVLERRGDLNGARIVLQQVVDLSQEGDADASRFQYNAAASERFDAVRAELERSLQARLPGLAQAVGAPAAREVGP